jgi:hypothetical protein
MILVCHISHALMTATKDFAAQLTLHAANTTYVELVARFHQWGVLVQR